MGRFRGLGLGGSCGKLSRGMHRKVLKSRSSSKPCLSRTEKPHRVSHIGTLIKASERYQNREHTVHNFQGELPCC